MARSSGSHRYRMWRGVVRAYGDGTAVQLAEPHRRGRAIGIAFGGFTIASVV